MSSPVKVLAAIFCVLLISCGSEDTPVPEASLKSPLQPRKEPALTASPRMPDPNLAVLA